MLASLADEPTSVASIARPLASLRRSEPSIGARAGEVFIEEGHPVRGAFLIVSGAVLLSRVTEDGRRHVLGLIGPGQIFGYTTRTVYECTVEPVVETCVRLLPLAEIAASPSLQAVLIEDLRRQLEASRDHAVRLQRRSAEQKLASFILSLPVAGTQREGAEGADDGVERIMLPLADCADFLSLRIETVCRVLSRFRKFGLVAMPAKGRLTLTDKPALMCLAHPVD